MNRTLAAAAVAAAVFAATPALADHAAYGAAPQPPAGAPARGCELRHDHRHDAAPVQSGRYELREVQQWTEGRYQQVWVPERCVARNHRVRVCRAGFYRQDWVPGSYVTAQEWVWVPYGYGRRDHHRRERRAEGAAWHGGAGQVQVGVVPVGFEVQLSSGF